MDRQMDACVREQNVESMEWGSNLVVCKGAWRRARMTASIKLSPACEVLNWRTPDVSKPFFKQSSHSQITVSYLVEIIFYHLPESAKLKGKNGRKLKSS